MVYICVCTTRFHSFTDGNIPSVCDRTFVGKVFTDYITDGIRPSEYLLSVIPHSVAISVGNKKKHIYRRPVRAKKKKFPAWNIPTEYIPSVLCKYRRTNSVGKSVGDILYRSNISVCKFVDKFIPTEIIRRWICRWWWVMVADTVQCRRSYSIGKSPCNCFFNCFLII